jgi:YidC/Oxa1 family membrane protein insertase
LNILPLFTVALFVVHQKLFTPPATDEQSQMQLTMMKYMTLFMGFLFFKVASGLCLYFIASSLWGIAERTLVPKPKVNLSGGPQVDKPAKSGEKAKNAVAVAEKKAARKKRSKRR